MALVAAGTGPRTAGRHAQLVCELPRDELAGSGSQLEHGAQHHRQLTDQLMDLLAAATGRPRDQLLADWARGRVLTAADAVTAGLIDAVDDEKGARYGS